MRIAKLLSCFVFLAVCLFAQEPVRYTVSFPAPHTHYLEVAASIPAGKPSLDLFMAVWTPGSYLVREYARNVEDFRAAAPGGKPLAWEKTSKNRWRVNAANAPCIEVRYKVYAHEPSVQGNWVDSGFAMLNGAPNFITLAGAAARPYEVKIDLPPAWTKSISGLPRKPGEVHAYLASSFDQLLDSPIYAGNAPIHEFDAAGKRHYLVNEGEGPMWDGPASAEAVRKVVEEYARMWGGLPYSQYVFFNMIVEQGGGLEHSNSTWLNTSRWAWSNTAEPAAPDAPARGPSRHRWLALVSHEYFHAWNVKRLRPEPLGPFDYENENYTRSLWISEGFTSYYGPLALKRAGLASPSALLNDLGSSINALQTTPGRLVQPVETSSFDTWIKLYRPNENSSNTAISYYTKGAVIGFLLDAKIRKATAGAKSLDDLMRLAYQRYSGPNGFTPAGFRQTASEVAGLDLAPWFRSALETTDELDYTEALAWYGLRFKPVSPNAPQAVNAGITTRAADGRLLIATVRRDTPAWNAGLNVDDEIVALNGIRVLPADWPSRLDRYEAGATVRVLVARRGQLMPIELPIVKQAPASWALEPDPGATGQQKQHLDQWLSSSPHLPLQP